LAGAVGGEAVTLTTGSRLGPYEILSALGAGGMGEVYRARDTKLNRDVAIKVLLPAVANDPDRLARFSREAQVLASLNHPNIAAIYGIEESIGVTALVMELVEGEDLSQRIARGPIPIDDALPIARQIAEALEAAHDHGIIHRDLKPANIKLRSDGTVKVLDFGLAKQGSGIGDQGSGNTANSPTLSVHATEAGIILGTAAYMSPEQAAGKSVDKRSDIWAFGAVLMEMLTGRRVFRGDTLSHVLAAVLKDEPDWTALPPDTPTAVRRLIKRCLEKDRKRRLADVADARLELDDVREPQVVASPPIWSRVVPWAVAALALALAIASWLVNPRQPFASLHPVHLLLSDQTPAITVGGERSFAISPDGRRVVFVADTGETRRLYLRDLGAVAASAIPGTEFANSPFFSPDGQRVGFFAASKLQVVTLDGGRPEALVDVITPRGATWASDDTIVYSPSTDAGLWSVPAAGGTPKLLAEPDPAKGERGYRWPQVLPGGEAVLFVVATSDILSFDDARLLVRSLRTGEQREVARGGVGDYVSTGHVVYARAGSLLAVPFDLVQLRTTGPPKPVVDGVTTFPASGSAQFAVSGNGTLLYVPGKAESRQYNLVWRSRTGETSPLHLPSAPYQQISMSPDRSQAAIDIDGANASIWILDLGRTATTRLTLEWSNNNPSWTSDPNRVAFSSSRAGQRILFWQRTDNQGAQEPVFPRGEFTGHVGFSTWPADGRSVIFDAADPRTARDIWLVQLDGDRKPKPLMKTPFSESDPSVSPDGRWLAYVSNESGRSETYIQPHPGPGAKFRISTDGAATPRWAHDGRELFYLSRTGMMNARIDPATGHPLGQPELLFGTPAGQPPSFGIGRDGRFLMITNASSETVARPITVVLNWFEELKGMK
jgi:Tol biopolymer transport system component